VDSGLIGHTLGLIVDWTNRCKKVFETLL
jgi:hypothetical protein